MKKINFLLIGILGILLLNSCKRVELEPRDWFGEDLVFDTLDRNGTVLTFNLFDLYNYLPGGFSRISGDYLDAASGDAVPSRNNTLVEYYTNKRFSVLNNPDPYWDNSYAGIRRVNIFLKNVGKVPTLITVDSTLSRTNRRYMRAEARFIRAQLYFELLKRYGGVPLIGDTVFSIKDNLQIPRNTYEECVNYIVAECNKAKDSLRVEAVADADWGRIPRGAAVALKSRVLLYAASPLYNGGGESADAAMKAFTGYPTYDANRWQLAVNAAEEFKALGYYGLLTTGTPTAYIAQFITKKNVEVILQKQSGNNFSLETNQAPVGFTGTVASYGNTSPTQNFVDAFPMSNGLQPFNPDGTVNAASGYSEAAPYTGRDPRLAATVFFNDATWLNRKIETFEGGLDKPNKSTTSVQTKTGYYLRKFLGNFATSTSYSNQSHNFTIFRYAEILLNYAEALNEVGRVEDAVTQIKLIRSRAGITPGTDSRYGISVGISQAAMRTLIQNERRIELAFEEHRFWDLRRWKLAPTALNTTLYGMKVTKNGTAFTYERVPVTNIYFEKKMYLMPFPYDEVIKNLQLKQNEGW